MAACANGGGPDGPTLEGVTPTASTDTIAPTQTLEPGATPATAVSTATEPIATSTPGEDGSILLACGDPLAPLDKLHRLEATCVPADLVDIPAELLQQPGLTLRLEATLALSEMLNAAAAEGHTIRVRSAYRSYDGQQAAFDYNVALFGLEEAKRVSALPGHSEHQLGTTVDLTSAAVAWDLDKAFGATPEGQWVAAHGWEYGFIISYPEGAEAITGYSYEPWHVRFLGVAVAADVVASGLTLHEYLLR